MVVVVVVVLVVVVVVVVVVAAVAVAAGVVAVAVAVLGPRFRGMLRRPASELRDFVIFGVRRRSL